jgi:predicted nucleotidyltransferase
MTTLIDPSYTYGDVPATELRKILELMTQFDRKDFNIKRAGDTRVIGRDPFGFYLSFFIRHGLMMTLEGGGFNLTQLGIDLISANFRQPISRSVAKVEIEELKRRATWILDDPDHLSYVRGIFIFGSYVDTEKAQLGDLDVGISIGLKPEIRKFEEAHRLHLAKSSYMQVVQEKDRQEDVDYLDWEKEKMLAALIDGKPYTSLHLSTEVPDLRVRNVLWIYDSRKPLSSHALLDKTQLKMVNSYLRKTA